MEGDLKKIQAVGQFMIEIWKVVGLNLQGVAGYARSHGKTPVCFGPTNLVRCKNGNSYQFEVSKKGTVEAID